MNYTNSIKCIVCTNYIRYEYPSTRLNKYIFHSNIDFFPEDIFFNTGYQMYIILKNYNYK